jgi:hypothetical protein
MDRVAGGILVLLLGLSVVLAADEGRDKPATPAEQYQALRKEYQTAGSEGGGSDEDRKKIIARVEKLRDSLARRFLELAETYRTDPIGVDALIQAVWMVNHNAFPAGGKDSPGGKALTLLLRGHVRSDRLGPICLRIASGFRGEYETFLRTLLGRNPHKPVRALACLALAPLLNNRLQRLDQIQEQPELAREYEGLFGQDYLTELRRQDRATVSREIEALFEQAAGKYGDEKVLFAGTVAEKAKAELFELRHLRVGQEAPDIEGEDQDGKRFKLSDYRGKVVLLDFWHQF